MLFIKLWDSYSQLLFLISIASNSFVVYIADHDAGLYLMDDEYFEG